jgi:hypothetical protein
MSICSERWRAAASLLLGSLLTVACFDVQQVAVDSTGPRVLEIDDFEDGDQLPSDSTFSTWTCGTYPGPPRISCNASAPGFGGGLAQEARFEIQDPPDGVVDQPGMFMQTSHPLGTLDLSSYERMRFSAKLGSDAPSFPGASRLYVRLRCDGVGTSGADPNGYWIETFVQVGSDWSSFTLALAELVRPNYVLSFSRSECIAAVESLEFGLHPDIPEGGSMVATLTIDEISLQ